MEFQATIISTETPALSRQEIYDRVKNHLLTQKVKAQDLSQGQCVYRSKSKKTGDILKCAVGCLIPDELYTESLEGLTISGAQTRIAL